MIWPYGLLLLVVVGLYGQSLKFGYVWDDNSLFLKNTWLREADWSWASIARPILPGTSYFRPLVLATWMAEMQLFELKPAYSHAINLVLHAINTCLLFTIACRVFERYDYGRNAALWAALLYTVHPCLVEGVAWISGRFDLLATGFLMAGCALAMTRATTAKCIAVAFLVLGSLLSKETGVLFAAILVLLVYARAPHKSIRATLQELWPYLFGYTVAVVVYFLLRRQGLGFASYSEFGLSQVVVAVFGYEEWLRKISFYTFMAFAPFSDLTPRHDWAIELISYRQQTIAVIAALLLLIVTVFYTFRRCTWAILLLGFYIAILPVLGIVSIAVGDTVGAERFLYLPLMMLSLSVVAFFLEIRKRYIKQRIIPLIGMILAIGWMIISVFVSYTVASMWESGLKLWSWQYELNPENYLVRSSYLLELSETKNPETIKIFEKTIEEIRFKNRGQLPGDVQILYANHLLAKGDPEAINYMRGLISNMPTENSEIKGEINKKTSEIIKAGIYSNYSQALIIFEGDLINAKNYLEKSQALNARGSEFNVIHQMIAINYLEGNFLESKKLYQEKLNLLKAFDMSKMKSSMSSLVEGYCILKHDNSYCHDYSVKFLKYLEGK